ncbi:MAG: HAD family hydrolase [Rhodospirillaceae bacterium]
MGNDREIGRRAVFLDRDGVINRAVVRAGKPYPPHELAEVEILPGVPEALQRLRVAGFELIVVTNQPDVARGTTPLVAVERINGYLRDTLGLETILTCVHDDADGCTCRKPRPGFLLQSSQERGLDLARSFMVGDRWRDVETGHNAGCRTVFIDYGYSERCPEDLADHVCASLSEAAQWIIDGAA